MDSADEGQGLECGRGGDAVGFALAQDEERGQVMAAGMGQAVFHAQHGQGRRQRVGLHAAPDAAR